MKKYETPILTVITLTTKDIITNSFDGDEDTFI